MRNWKLGWLVAALPPLIHSVKGCLALADRRWPG